MLQAELDCESSVDGFLLVRFTFTSYFWKRNSPARQKSHRFKQLGSVWPTLSEEEGGIGWRKKSQLKQWITSNCDKVLHCMIAKKIKCCFWSFISYFFFSTCTASILHKCSWNIFFTVHCVLFLFFTPNLIPDFVHWVIHFHSHWYKLHQCDCVFNIGWKTQTTCKEKLTVVACFENKQWWRESSNCRHSWRPAAFVVLCLQFSCWISTVATIGWNYFGLWNSGTETWIGKCHHCRQN